MSVNFKDKNEGVLEPLKKPLKGEFEEDYECEEFDDILELVGTRGRYQKVFLYGVLAPMVLLMPFFIVNMIFILYVPDHWCLVPGRDNMTDIEDWKNLTLPTEIGPDGKTRYSQCLMFDPEVMNETISCTNGWEYDKSDYESTMPSTYNWVCSKLSYSTNALTLSAIGNAVGTISTVHIIFILLDYSVPRTLFCPLFYMQVFGTAADKYGRKPIFYITCFLNIIFRMISLFVPHIYGLFLFCQFVVGLAFPMMFIAPSMINVETCDKEYRAWVYAFTWMTWVIGMCIMPLLAYLLRDWFVIGLATSVTGLFFVFYYRMVRESPRWLVSVGKIKEAKEIILHIAKTNKNEDKISEKQLDIMLKKLVVKMSKEKHANDKTGIWTLFSRKRLCKHTILLTISWSMNLLVYYGITLNTPNMSGNQFFNFFVLSIIELPSGMSGGYLAEKFGRRWLQVLFYFCVSITCLIAAFVVVYDHLSGFVMALILIAKFSITLTNLVMYMQGTEIFPTQLRSTGTGFASTIGSTAGILGPYIIYLGRFNVSGPYIVMGVLALIAMVVSSFLPETMKQSLPQTVEEANDFGKDNKYWSFRLKVVKKEEISNGHKFSPVVKRHGNGNNNSDKF